MGWFSPASGLSNKAEQSLRHLAESGQSEAAGVADILNTIAENSEEQALNEHLVDCSGQIIEAAEGFIRDVHGSDAVQSRVPFNREELLIIFEAARIAMADGEVFDRIAEDMDLADEAMKGIQEKLFAYLDGGTGPGPRR